MPFEIERGLYDHDTHHQEIRLIPVEGETPVAYAHATGTVTVKAKPEKQIKQVDNILKKLGNKWDKILKGMGK